ncbi:MAG: formyltransferase family protein, partial [Gemmatimonadales bacterium]
MRIALLLNRDIESCLALNLLQPLLGDRIAAVFLSERVGGPVAGRAKALGQLGFVEQTLFNRLVFPLVEGCGNADGRLISFDEFGRRFGVPVRSVPSARSAPGLEALRAANADLFLSLRFGHILGADAIAIPPRGVLNLHSGLLPAYRGVLATFRALLAGDAEIGCTLHWIDSPAIDRGGIIATARQPVDRS